MKVPTYDSPQVQQEALPGVRTQALEDPAGQAVGQGLEQLGQGVTRGADEIEHVLQGQRHKANTIWAANAHTQMAHDGTTVLDGNQGGTADVNGGDPSAATKPAGDEDIGHAPPTGPSQAALAAAGDPASGLSQKGLLNEQGQAAAKYAHPTLDWLAKRRDQIALSAPNEEARQMFLESSGKLLEDYRGTAERHTAQQLHVAAEQTASARGAVALAQIGKDASAPGATDGNVAYSLDSNVDEVARTIKALNPGEVGEQQAQAFKQKATELVLQHYIDAKDTRGAQNFFDQRREDLGAKADDLGKAVKVLVDQQAGQQLGSKLVADATDKSGLVNPAAAVAGFQKLTPEQQRIAEPAFNKGLRLAQEAAVSMAKDIHTAGYSQWVQNHSLADVAPEVRARMIELDPVGWHGIEEADRQWKAQQAAGARGRKVGETPEQALAYATFMDQSVRRPDDFKKLTPEQIAHDFLGRVTPERLEKMQDRVRQLHGQKPQSEQSLPGWMTNVIVQSGRESTAFPDKGNPATMPGDAGRDYTTAEARVMSERAAYKAANQGKEPTPDMVRGWAADELAKVKVKGSGWLGSDFFDQEVTRAKLERSPEYRGKDTAPVAQDAGAGSPPNQPPAAQAAAPAGGGGDVPPEWKAAVVAKFQKAGQVPPSDDELRAVYLKAHPKAAAPALPASTPPIPPPQQSLVHPTSQGVFAQVAAALRNDPKRDYEAGWHQAPPWAGLKAETQSADTAKADKRAEIMKAHPGWKIYQDRLVGPTGESVALP